MKLLHHFLIAFLLPGFIISCEPTEEQLISKAEKIHRSILTLDSHTDTPLQLGREGFDIGKRNDPHNRGGKLDFPRMQEGSLDAVFFAVFLSQGQRNDEAYQQAAELADRIFEMVHTMLEENREQAEPALTPDDAYRIKKQGKRAIYLCLENGYPLGLDVSLVQKYYGLGARYITLCHTRNNDICDSSTDPDGAEHSGLSEFGKAVVNEMNRIGMMVDVSHISDQAFYDVLEISTVPVIASHSNARNICKHPRNLDDAMLQALKVNGGVIQLCLLGSYVKEMEPNLEKEAARKALREKYNNFENLPEEEMDKAREEWHGINRQYPDELATVSDLIDHVDHIVNLIGIDYVGIGSDFDGGGALEDCYDVSQMSNITLELVRRGYSKKDIEKIWAGNFMRVFREVTAAAENTPDLS
jgi:membrane dipeptidase